MSLRSINGAFVIVLIVLASAGRLIYLDADPSFPTWIGYVVDEGRWSETARNLALFGDPDVNWFSRLHLFISPGYQAVNYIVFLALGVDFWSVRLFGAVAGVLVVLTVFVALRRHVTSLALAFGVVALGLETNVFWASRMALPEMPAVLATLLAFFLLVLGRKTPWSAGIAGLLVVVAVAMKGTTVLAVLIFPVIALIVPPEMPLRARIVRATAFVAGFTLPVVAACTALSVCGYLTADAVSDIASRFLGFLSWTSAYLVVSRFFDSTELEARNLLLLGMWFCSWLWFYRQAGTRIAGELYVASGIWAGWWLLVWSANTYLPGRYLVHFVVPATIHIMAGLSLGGPDSVARIVANLEKYHGLMRATVLYWLVLPSAIVIASVVVGLAGVAGWNADRLLERIVIVALLATLLTSIEYARQIDERSIVRFLSFPVLMALLWLGERELGMIGSFWMSDPGVSVALWAAAAVGAFLLCFNLTPQIHSQAAHAGLAAIAMLAVILMAQAAPAIVFPTYSLRDASRDLQQHLPVDRPVRTVMAASLFLENGIKYHELPRKDQQIGGLVSFEHSGVARQFPDPDRTTHLVQVHAYPLTVSPRYLMVDEKGQTPVVHVYRAK